MTVVDEKSGTVIVRPDVKGKRENELNRTSEKWANILVVRGQKVIRGFLGRRRVNRIREYNNTQRIFFKTQAIVRGWLYRKRLKKMARLTHYDQFMFRKQFSRKAKAALQVTSFIRFIINREREKKGDPLLRSKIISRRVTIASDKSKAHKKRGAKSGGIVQSKTGQLVTDDLASQEGSQGGDDDDVSVQSQREFDDVSRISGEEFGGAGGEGGLGGLGGRQQHEEEELDTDDEGSKEEVLQKDLKNMTADDEAAYNARVKQRAINFIIKMSNDKPTKDNVKTSRLIPKYENPGSNRKFNVMSSKNRTFLVDHSKGKPKPFIGSSHDVYVGPRGIPRGEEKITPFWASHKEFAPVGSEEGVADESMYQIDRSYGLGLGQRSSTLGLGSQSNRLTRSLPELLQESSYFYEASTTTDLYNNKSNSIKPMSFIMSNTSSRIFDDGTVTVLPPTSPMSPSQMERRLSSPQFDGSNSYSEAGAGGLGGVSSSKGNRSRLNSKNGTSGKNEGIRGVLRKYM